MRAEQTHSDYYSSGLDSKFNLKKLNEANAKLIAKLIRIYFSLLQEQHLWQVYLCPFSNVMKYKVYYHFMSNK